MSTPKRPSPNGRKRLLSFLRDLLNDVSYIDVIMWTDEAEQEFQLMKPHRVAELWGAATGNLSMTYDKMSRGLRYFYDNKQIAKMPGKNSRYKFLNNSNHSSPNSSFNISHIKPDPHGQNKSLSSSPTSSASSAGSTSPIAAFPAAFPMLPAFFPTNLAQMATLTQNLTQFNEFKMKYPLLQSIPIPAQIQLFFNMRNAFPALFQPAVLPGVIPAAPIL
ncbi:unnamed protein product [Caenorhabditis brenneri]